MSDRTYLSAEGIRKSSDNYKAAKRDGWENYPIRTWGPFVYIVCDKIDLKYGEQTIIVIDITGDNDVARFSLGWPDTVQFMPSLTEKEIRDYRRYALVSPPEEGVYWLVMTEDRIGKTGFDNHYYCTSQHYAADLSIFVGSTASGEIDQMIGDIAWAVAEARQYGWNQEDKQIADTIRTAARRSSLPGARQGNSRRWYFDKSSFREWLADESAHRTGPKSAIEDLITSGADARTIQHTLADMVRQNTGQIPRIQLWQPCEHPGCFSEPSCGNCFMCQDEHCHCFDDD